MKKYNVGIIGYGWAATAHIEAINKTTQGQVTAIFSSRKLDDAELSAKFGRPMKSYTSLDEMLKNPDIHVVDITSYPSQHRDQAVAAANAKKHVILEKPMANSLQEVREITAAAKANGVQGCVCFECRFSNQFTVTKALIDEGVPIAPLPFPVAPPEKLN
jgi:predicted dehydrogenase